MSRLALGQPVTITDFLERAELTAEEVVSLADAWPEIPAPILEEAKTLLDKSGDRFRYGRARYRVFVPSSLVGYPRPSGLHGVTTASKHHRTPWRGDLTFPLHGVVIQQVQLQDGTPFYEEYGAEFHRLSTRTGFRVAYHLNRRPLTVLPSMIEEAA